MIIVFVSRLHYFPRTSKGLLDSKKKMYGALVAQMVAHTPKTHTNEETRFLLSSTQSSLALVKLTRKAAKKPFDLFLSLGPQFSSMLLLAVLMSFETWLLCW